MAEFVAPRQEPIYTERNCLPFYIVPERFILLSTEIHKTADRTKNYGRILDCVFEMADEMAHANGIAVMNAIEQVLKTEAWHILPMHKDMIERRLLLDDTCTIGTRHPKGHVYRVEIDLGRGMSGAIEVLARNRIQAASLTRRHGFKMCSINMIG